MNLRLLSAALIAGFTTFAHLFFGVTDVVSPLLETPALPLQLRLTIFAVWHLTSLTLGFSALALFIGSIPRYAQSVRSLVLFISILWLGFAAIFAMTALSQPGSEWLFRLQQWTVLLPVGLLGLWGYKKMA